MTAVRVEVTAEIIAAAARVADVGEGWTSSAPEHKDPVELAIQEATGQPVTCDSDDGPERGMFDEMATIGSGQTVIVVNLGADVARFIDRYYRGESVEPFSFDIALEDWLVGLVAKAGAA